MDDLLKQLYEIAYAENITVEQAQDMVREVANKRMCELYGATANVECLARDSGAYVDLPIFLKEQAD